MGAGAEHLLGQRIVGIPVMAHGGYATHAIVDAATAFGIPASMSSVDGAAMHYPFHLGWFALHERARLQPGETLLVHAGAGGTGSGAVQIGKALGAKVIATAGTDEKVEYCKGLGADHAINYRSGDFVAEIEELTYGRGVDVAFDAVGGDVTVQTFKCMGFNGRHLIAGWSENIQLEHASYFTPWPIAYGNFSICGVCLVYVSDPLGTRRTMGFNWPRTRRRPGRARQAPRAAAHRHDPHHDRSRADVRGDPRSARVHGAAGDRRPAGRQPLSAAARGEGHRCRFRDRLRKAACMRQPLQDRQ